MSTLASLITLTREYIKIDPNARVFSDNTLTNFINRAYFQLQKDWHHEWRQCYDNATTLTIAGTQEYWLPTDFIALNFVSYNNKSLIKSDRIKLKRLDSNNPMTSGTPNMYYLYGGNIWMYPIPNTTGTIDLEYLKRLPTLSSSQDSLFPADFDDAIALYASYIAFKSVNKMDLAQMSLWDYQQVLDTLFYSYISDDTNMSFGIERCDTRWYSSDTLY